MESKGQFDKALQYYRKAEDHLSLVRVHCYESQVEEARKVVQESGDPSAAYHLARHYENEENVRLPLASFSHVLISFLPKVKEAIQFYARAQCFNHGIRLAIEHELDSEVHSLALQTTGRLVIQAAKYESLPVR